MMSGVRMTHPDLDGREITAPPSAVPHYRAAGWQVVPGQDVQGEEWPPELQPFGGQDQIRMRHPNLGDAQITVAESAVPFHREKGWQRVDDETEPAAEAAPAPEPKPRRRSSQQTSQPAATPASKEE